MTLTAGPPRHAARTAMKYERSRKGRSKSLRDAREIAAFPRQLLAKRHQDKQRQEQRHEGHIEERRADRDFFARNGFKRQRIKRADENRGATCRQQQIVENERALRATPARKDHPASNSLARTGEEREANRR